MLNELRSSSLLRLFCLRKPSAAEGGGAAVCATVGVAAEEFSEGTSELDGARDNGKTVVEGVDTVGESILISSLTVEELPRGNGGGGGVRVSVLKLFQKSLDADGLRPKSPNRPLVFDPKPEVSRLLGVSSGIPSSDSMTGCNVGDDCAVDDWRRSISMSLSRTWRITSASFLISASTGMLSSSSSARMRPNARVFG